MLVERIEAKWIDAFAEVFRLCGVEPGDECAVLAETQSRGVNVELSELALKRLGANVFRVTMQTPAQTAPVAIRSTGASDAIGGSAPVIAALSQVAFIADCTVEGLLHAPELPQLLGGGARTLMVSNEHPDILERLVPDTALEAKVKIGTKMLRGAKEMRVTSAAGTDLTIDVETAPAGSSWGYTARPGTIAHWPGGLCLCFPGEGR